MTPGRTFLQGCHLKGLPHQYWARDAPRRTFINLPRRSSRRWRRRRRGESKTSDKDKAGEERGKEDGWEREERHRGSAACLL